MNLIISNINKTLPLVVILSLAFSSVFAQLPQQQEVRDDFSKEELKSFVKANEKVMEIEMKSEEKMINVIEEEGLTIEKFNHIVQAQQDPNTKTNATQEELASFNSAAQEIIKENQEKETKIISSIESEGIDINTYQEILIAYQQNPEIQKKVNDLIKKDN